MARWVDRYKSAKSAPTRGGAGGADYDELPMLSEALAGVKAPHSDAWDSPPSSLTLWLEGGILKFCIGSQFDLVKTFGTTEGLSAGLMGIENALKNDRCETKKVKGTR